VISPAVSCPDASHQIPLVIFSATDCVWRDDGRGPAEAAIEPIQWLVSREIPLVLVSRRSAADVVTFQRELGFRQPFVSDGGKALFVPHGYFPDVTRLGTVRGGWDIVEFSPPYDASAAVRLLTSLFQCCSAEVIFVGLSGDDQQAAELRALPCESLHTITRAEAWSEAILGPKPA
jgi:predicted mannosyl-3-phosphoglycerate phosphatase (HAD superfamily)